MAFKDLFINSDSAESEQPKKAEPIKMPTAASKFPTASVPESTTATPSTGLFGAFGKTASFEATKPTYGTGEVSEQVLLNAVQSYQNGFDSLNQPGFDFYEFHKLINEQGADNPQVYPLALSMAKSMDGSITKEKLVEQSDYYIGEIKKVHEDFTLKGNSKKNEIIQQKSSESQNLSGELESIKQQIELLQHQLTDKTNKLSAIDGKYIGKLTEIDEKLRANDIAKDTILKSIETVKTGIINIK